jgi:hypothetical protein
MNVFVVTKDGFYYDDPRPNMTVQGVFKTKDIAENWIKEDMGIVYKRYDYDIEMFEVQE